MESYYKQNKKLITDILDILEGHFGKNVEFVVHDLSLDYEHTIVDIRNGEVTGRKVGGTGDLLGLRALRYNGSNEGDCFNTLTYAENGKILRSSTLFFRNGAGVAVASIAINEDVTESIKYEQYLHKQNRTEESGDAMELYRGDVNRMLDYLINSALLEVGKNPSAMTKEDKMRIVELLDRRGAFLITKSGSKVCDVLDISKFTLYNYLETIRKESGQK